MPTWRDEFARLSEIERNAIDEWKKNPHATNAVINAKEATAAFLKSHTKAGSPDHDAEMPKG